ncbi:MAG: selenocysteine-specific translation elongation factor [Firmicutes bacterium]|nr:selenocysteine-specific translation elongation factor [Bacillota bacterium]
MKHIVIGTAGHVDHGKTSLTRALTGIDTDRLEEEKRRGMTIDLGFAPLRLPSGMTVSIIDVPGHERFVKNMVAGATTIDMALLVISADEGIMEQTREHVEILSLLGINAGIVAVTKVDLVDEGFLMLVLEDVESYLKTTPFAGAKVIPVSTVTGEGIDDLVSEIDRLAMALSEQESSTFFRLPVDRVFTVVGHGTVITGTVIGGEIHEGEMVELVPQKKVARIRGIQVHDQKVDHASAGDRAALNLSGIDKNDINRGDVAVRPGTLPASSIADAWLTALSGQQDISHGQRVRVHIGTAEVMARLRVIGAESIEAGFGRYVQIRFEAPVAIARGDRFIVRSYSPIRTIGGGRILMHNVRGRSRFAEKELDELAIEDKGSDEDLVGLLVAERPCSIKDLATRLTMPPERVGELARKMAPERVRILPRIDTSPQVERDALPPDTRIVSTAVCDSLLRQIMAMLKIYYKKFPYRVGMPKDDIRPDLAPDWEDSDFDTLLNLFISDGILAKKGNLISDPGMDREDAILKRPEVSTMEEIYRKEGLNTKKPTEVILNLSMDSDQALEILRFLVETGRLIKISEDVVLHQTVVEDAKSALMEKLKDGGELTAGQAKNVLGTNRRIIIPLLEYFDRLGITKRIGDVRRLADRNT